MSSFKLRPHHGLCIQFFQGKGYSPEFVQHMTEIISFLDRNNPAIMLTVETDNICSHCPHNQGTICDSAKKVQQFDTAVLQYCNLQNGSQLSWNEFQETFRTSILQRGILAKICGNCQWSEICQKGCSSQ